jgi:hypothetical protein
VGGANGAGTVTWALDYMTPDGLLASLEETNADPAAFVRRMTNSGTALPIRAPSSVNGQAWNLSATPARGQRSMYRTSPAGFTLVVTATPPGPNSASSPPPSTRYDPATPAAFLLVMRQCHLAVLSPMGAHGRGMQTSPITHHQHRTPGSSR